MTKAEGEEYRIAQLEKDFAEREIQLKEKMLTECAQRLEIAGKPAFKHHLFLVEEIMEMGTFSDSIGSRISRKDANRKACCGPNH